MNILVTAGNTLVPIDKVRCLTNVFTGRTGAQLALTAQRRSHRVLLLTSHPEAVSDLAGGAVPAGEGWTVQTYRTFEDLCDAMQSAIRPGNLDAVIHSAAVSDYLAAGVYAPAPGTRFRPDDGCWESTSKLPKLLDRQAGKVKSDEPELWLRLVRAPKLIDLIRSAWGFPGILVKFKLEVGIDEERLLEIAESSRLHSHADLMAANTLEGAADWAHLGPLTGKYERIPRSDLSTRLIEAVERLHREGRHG